MIREITFLRRGFRIGRLLGFKGMIFENRLAREETGEGKGVRVTR